MIGPFPHAVGILLDDGDRPAATPEAWSLVRVDDPWHALAQLCLHCSGQQQREAWGLLADDAPVVVVIAPNATPPERERALIRAIRTHLPETRLFRHTGTALEPIEPRDAAPPAPAVRRDAEPAPRAHAATAVPRALTLRESPDDAPLTPNADDAAAPDPLVDDAAPREAPDLTDDPTRVTEEEISMLFEERRP